MPQDKTLLSYLGSFSRGAKRQGAKVKQNDKGNYYYTTLSGYNYFGNGDVYDSKTGKLISTDSQLRREYNQALRFMNPNTNQPINKNAKTSKPKTEQIGKYTRLTMNSPIKGTYYRWVLTYPGYDPNRTKVYAPPAGWPGFIDKEVQEGDWVLKPDRTKVHVSTRRLTPTNAPKAKKVSVNNTQTDTTKSGSDITYDGGQSPGVEVIGPKQKTRRTNSSKRTTSTKENEKITVGDQNKSYVPEEFTPQIMQGVSIPPVVPNMPKTIEVPQVSTPGNFNRRDIRNLLRTKGIDPYYEVGALQRRALRRYLNGEPVAGEYQDFINKIMQ